MRLSMSVAFAVKPSLFTSSNRYRMTVSSIKPSSAYPTLPFVMLATVMTAWLRYHSHVCVLTRLG